MTENLFAQLQAVSTLEANTTILELRKQLNDLIAWFKKRDTYLQEVTTMAKFVRALGVQTLLDCDSFMVQNDFYLNELPEKYKHESLGFVKNKECVFRGRYVYPVKDVRGDVMGLCGYDKFDDIKYKDSLNYGYRAKSYSVWGMEMLPIYYRNAEPVFFVEGIVCALYLRQCNLQSLAMLGSQASAYVIQIMKRFAGRCIVVCDADEAGSKCRASVRRRVPEVLCVQSTVAKDVDDSRKVCPEFVEELAKLTNPYYSSKLFK